MSLVDKIQQADDINYLKNKIIQELTKDDGTIAVQLEEIEKLKQEATNLQQRLQSNAELKNQQRLRNNRLQEQNEALEDKVTALITDLQKANSRIEVLNGQIDDYLAEIAELSQQLQTRTDEGENHG